MSITLPISGELYGFEGYCQYCTAYELEQTRTYYPQLEGPDLEDSEISIWCRHADACARMARRYGVMQDDGR